MRTPLISTGANGLPDAKIARPLVHVHACSAVHSDFDVGLEYGKITGDAQYSSIASITSRVNAPACVLVPMSTVGFTACTASTNVGTSAPSRTKSC